MEKLNQNKALRRQHHPTPDLAVTYQSTDETPLPCPPDVEKFIHEALTKRKPSLIPFATISQSVAEMAKYLKRHCSQSHSTAYLYIWSVHQYCKWCGADPDQLITECFLEDALPNQKALLLEARRLDDYVGALQSEGYSPGHIANCVKAVKTFYRINGLRLELPYKLRKYVVSRDRAPTPEEIARLIDLADVRGKVIVSMLALGAFRIGTLCKLCYRHVRHDLERDVVPVHIHVEATITKGKYHDYDTFIGREAVDNLKAYLEARRNGGLPNKIPPENLNDESPLIRDEHSKVVKPLTPSQVYNILHRLMAQAGLLGSKVGRRYTMRPHSIRKFFRTQMAALGIQTDYIEYMMGHTISTYHDIRMKGIEFLRGIYAASGLSINPKTKPSRIQILKEITRALGLNPEEILTKEALAKPHRTIIAAGMKTNRDQDHVDTLLKALKQKLKQEITSEMPNAILKTV
ncbi:MAG: tyrosine-type recombinase/integrase [Candidatus Bathyarchaeia archaeon]